jgi:hypothetical protein
MTSWFRIVGYSSTKESPLLIARIRTATHPIIFTQPIIQSCVETSLQHAVDTVATSAIQMRSPFVLSAWAKYALNHKDRQVILTRIMLRPRDYDSMYWLVATECTTKEHAAAIAKLDTTADPGNLKLL